MRRCDRQQRNRGKKTLCVVLTLTLLLPQMSILAEESSDYEVQEPDVSVKITPEMELNGTTGIATEGEDGTLVNRVSVSDGVIYDFDLGKYCYPVAQGYVYSNVMDGMIVQGGVELSKDENVNYTVYYESEPLSVQDAAAFTDAGSYTVMTGSTEAEEKLFSFQIIGAAINEPTAYELPSGCVATAMKRDGVDVLTDIRKLDLSEEGFYSIFYRCVRNNLEYSLNFTVDHTAPTVSFEGLEDGKARGEVTILDLEEGATLEVYRDGEKVAAKTTLSQPGEYQIRVSDAAGNASLYSFYILFYLNAGGISFGVVLLLAILALGIYLYVSRKRVRIR